MHVIVVASQKGGAGKTTLTSHLAVEAERAGAGLVVVMDTDPQGGLADWCNARQAETPAFVRPEAGGLAANLAALRRSGVDLVMIDTPPAITSSIAATIGVADLVLVPARPSPNDLRAVHGTVALVEAARKPVVFIVNSVKPRVRLTGEAAIALSQYGTVAPVMVWDRTDYAAAMTDGRTAPEIDPAGKAATEMADLWRYIAGRLEQGRGGHNVETRQRSVA